MKKMPWKFSLYVYYQNKLVSIIYIKKKKYDFFRRHVVVMAHCSVLDGSMQRMSSYLNL